MHVVVCVKQTPDSAAKISVENGKVAWGDSGLVVNPWDEYAIEEAIRLKEKHGGKATAISMGPDSAKEALKTCLAMGCDEAQGYHMAKPMPADDLTMWLHESPWGLKGGG